MSILAAAAVPLIGASGLVTGWMFARSGPNKRVKLLLDSLVQADVATDRADEVGRRATQLQYEAETRATATADQRDAYMRDLYAVLTDLVALADRWESLAPAPGSYQLAGRELRAVLARHRTNGAAR